MEQLEHVNSEVIPPLQLLCFVRFLNVFLVVVINIGPLGFFLLNYVAAFTTWYKLEKNKISTIIFPIFNIYPIYGTVCSLFSSLYSIFLDALRVIRRIIENPLEAPKIKRKHLATIGLKEVFLESTPTTLIIIGMIILGFRNNSTFAEGLNYVLTGNWDLMFSPDHVIQEILFSLTMVSSMLSSAFGVAR